MKHVHKYSYILLSFVKLLFNVIEIISNVKMLKIMKRVIFILFILEKNQVWINVKNLCIIIYKINIIYKIILYIK